MDLEIPEEISLFMRPITKKNIYVKEHEKNQDKISHVELFEDPPNLNILVNFAKKNPYCYFWVSDESFVSIDLEAIRLPKYK